jgi:hypothetical protein
MAKHRVTAACAAFALGALALSGCAGQRSADVSCPKVTPAPGADTIVVFRPGGHDASDVIYGGRIYSIDAACVHEKVGLTVNAQIVFYGERADRDLPVVTFPYFVALIDPQSNVLQEESFKVPINFVAAESYRRSPAEEITVHLPLKNSAVGGAYTVLVGFQLTPDQLAFNRSRQKTQQ